jgi:hypothetical protein
MAAGLLLAEKAIPRVLRKEQPEMAMSQVRLQFSRQVPYGRVDYVDREVNRLTRVIVKRPGVPHRREGVLQWGRANIKSGEKFTIGESDVFWELVELGTDFFLAQRAPARKPAL